MPTGFVWRRLGSSERLSSLTLSRMASCLLRWAVLAFAQLMPRHQLQQLPALLGGARWPPPPAAGNPCGNCVEISAAAVAV